MTEVICTYDSAVWSRKVFFFFKLTVRKKTVWGILLLRHEKVSDFILFVSTPAAKRDFYAQGDRIQYNE